MASKLTIKETPESRRTKQKTLGEIITTVQRLHQRCARLYAERRTDASGEPAMMLDVLIEQEQIIAIQLEEYKTRATPEVLETWIKYAPESPLADPIELAEFDPGQGRAEIAEMAGALSDWAISVYATIEAGTSAPSVQEAIAALRAFEENEKIRSMRSGEG